MKFKIVETLFDRGMAEILDTKICYLETSPSTLRRRVKDLLLWPACHTKMRTFEDGSIELSPKGFPRMALIYPQEEAPLT